MNDLKISVIRAIRPKSDILDHCQKCHTDVLSENFTIEDSHKGKYGFEILESLHQ